MKPPPIEYQAPGTLDEALSILSSGDDAKVLAGGQSLVPLLSFRLAFPETLVDLRRIDELGEIEDRGDTVEIGAMVTQLDAERNDLLAEKAPLIASSLDHVAHPQVRARGTVGGSVAHADPAAELPAVMLALGATVRVRGPEGSREVAAENLFVTMLTTSLAEDEILTSIVVPDAGEATGAACSEIARRRGDYALCGAVAQVAVAGDEVASARVAYFGIGDQPVRSEAVEAAAVGKGRGEAGRAAAETAAGELEVKGDATVSERYRRQLAAVVTERAIEEAMEKAV